MVHRTRDDLGMPSPRRSYGGLSAETRRQERRARLLEATIDAMTGNEWRTATVDRICAAANLNKRYFYESFTGLDALGAAVIDDIADGVREATLSAVNEVTDQSVDTQALVGVAAAVHALVHDPRRARVLLGGVSASAAVQTHRLSVMRGLTRVLVARGRSVHGVELEDDPLAKVAPPFIIGGTAEAILAFVNGAVDLSLDELIAQLATLWLITGNGAADVARTRSPQTDRP